MRKAPSTKGSAKNSISCCTDWVTKAVKPGDSLPFDQPCSQRPNRWSSSIQGQLSKASRATQRASAGPRSISR